MPDTKRGREEQARHKDRRQRERDVRTARERTDEREPEREAPDGPSTCHRRGCDRPAAFLVLERYLEDTGHGAVEATAELCQDHTAEEHPTRLDDVYADYVFRVEPLPGTTDADES